MTVVRHVEFICKTKVPYPFDSLTKKREFKQFFSNLEIRLHSELHDGERVRRQTSNQRHGQAQVFTSSIQKRLKALRGDRFPRVNAECRLERFSRTTLLENQQT